MNIRIDNRNENIFSIAGVDWIKFPEVNGAFPMVYKTYDMDLSFGYDSNFAESSALYYLQTSVLPWVEEAVGAENLVEFETDLTSIDKDDRYGIVRSKISIPTLKFYRDNKKIFDKYSGYCWWTATPYNIDCGSLCWITGDGDERNKHCERYNGIRPMIMVKASVFNR